MWDTTTYSALRHRLPRLTPWLCACLLTPVPHSMAGQESNVGFRAAFQPEWDSAARRLDQLAEAIPEKTYGWRPSAGVRSVSEAIMHVAAANFSLAAALGSSQPDDLPKDPEKIVDKAEVLRLLRRSFEHLGEAMERVLEGDLDQAPPKDGTTAKGRFGDGRRVLLRALAHSNEHRGQLVAYARMNGVVPPWSR